MRFEILRFFENEFQTLGKFVVFDDWNCELAQGFIMELPYKDNQTNVSRIDEGEYDCVKRNSQKYGDHFHILDVPGRDYILIHIGNYHTDTRGCLLPGEGLVDIDGDGLRDVTGSGSTMRMLNEIMDEQFKLIIKNQIL